MGCEKEIHNLILAQDIIFVLAWKNYLKLIMHDTTLGSYFSTSLKGQITVLFPP